MSATWRWLVVTIVGLGCAATGRAAALADCRAIAEPAARLVCYDTLAPPTAKMAAPAVSAAPPPAPMPPPEQRFGLPEHQVIQSEVAAGTRTKDASTLHAQIVQLQPAPDRRMVFTLDNSQVWRQLNAEGDLLAKPGDTVTISRGLLGSFWLQAPSGRGCKVSRLR